MFETFVQQREFKQDAKKFWEEPPQASMWKPCANTMISQGKTVLVLLEFSCDLACALFRNN